MKTKIALAFYYISIGFLVACAAVIVVKLIFWPPCTQIGNTCAIDPWSTAGLAGTVLAVAATVLAILGAVAVAAWWTSLNARVNEQVTKLYNEQSEEANARVNLLLHTLEAQVDSQLAEFQSTFDQLHTEIDRLRGEVAAVHKFSDEMSGLMMKSYKSDAEVLSILKDVIAISRRELSLPLREKESDVAPHL